MRDKKREPQGMDRLIKRRDSLEEAIKQEQQEDPSLIGMTIYGSMSRVEKISKDSDVDGYIFIEVDDSENPTKIIRSIEKNEEFNSETSVIDFAPLTKNMLNDKFRTIIRRKLSLPNRQTLGDVKVLPISKSIIEDEIKTLALKLKEDIQKQKEHDLELAKGNFDHPRPRVRHYSPADSVAFLFLQSLNASSSNIAQYRNKVMQEIKKYPDIAEKIWGRLILTAHYLADPKDTGAISQYRIARTLYEFKE